MAADVWFGAIVAGLFLYVIMDGNDLGMGILSIGLRDNDERRETLELVASVWDGNESWILLIAVGLWGGFPSFASAYWASVYPVLIIMLWSLILRGVSIEMISNSRGWPRGWGRLFMGGSLVAAFLQGVAVGALVQGVRLGPHDRFVGGTWDFLSGFTVLTGIATVVLYSVTGAAMVKMRAESEPLRAMFSRQGRWLVLLLVGLVALTGGLLPVAGASSLTLDQPLRVALIVWLCLVAGVSLLLVWWSFGQRGHDNMAFTGMAVAELAGLGGLLTLAWPMLVPPSLTVAQAASPSSSLDFLIGGFGTLVPVTIAYSAYSFWVLRPRRIKLGKGLADDFVASAGNLAVEP